MKKKSDEKEKKSPHYQKKCESLNLESYSSIPRKFFEHKYVIVTEKTTDLE